MTTIENESRSADEVLVAALGEGLSYTAAGEVAGCSKATVARRMREPDFRARVVAAREAAAEEAASLVEGLSLRAAERLSALVDAESEFVALKASLSALDRADQRQQARAFGDRLERLEGLIVEVLDGKRGLRSAA